MANVLFLWHMHQPYYVDPVTRTALMPWVRLHSVKGYLDMISIIEDFPRIHPNFNLTPVLLLQIEEIITGQTKDLWLEWSRKPASELDEEERLSILENFFKIHWDNLIKPYPRYWELLNKRGRTFYKEDVRHSLRYWTSQEMRDLQVWYNLAWCGYTADRLYPELETLRQKGRGFNEEEKLRVLEIHLEIMRLVLAKYRDAEARGQAELTTTPFFHPILPLVYDSHFAERCLPGREFPKRFHWPQDAAAQLTKAVQQHERFFGVKPRGLWPSEGSIAPELIPLMQQAGIQYFCSDEENLFNSMKRDPVFQHSSHDHLELFQGWRVRFDGSAVNAVFREKPLSDFIGFMAARNDPQHAANHLLHHLHHIAGMVPKDTGAIPLILDGENAWETFADGGQAFLRALYKGIEEDSSNLHSCTIEDYFNHHPPQKELTTLHTGSWICSNFDIWIGEEEENRGWDLLGETRSFLQSKINSGTLSEEQKEKAMMEIYAAEGSDWFWWYGPDFHTDCDEMFDSLFRQHLRNVYQICDSVPPHALDQPVIIAAKPVDIYSEPQHLISPVIDGRASSFFEWTGAGAYVAGSEQGAMYRADRFLDQFFFGFDSEALYFRLDLAKWGKISFALNFLKPSGYIARTGLITHDVRQGFTLIDPAGNEVIREGVAAKEVVEWRIALEDLKLKPGNGVAFQLQVLTEGIARETYPESGPSPR